jgi:hypothetical protein
MGENLKPLDRPPGRDDYGFSNGNASTFANVAVPHCLI